jgi:probable rRNA maturation factor
MSDSLIEVINRQRHLPIDCKRWQEFTSKALRKIGSKDQSVTVVFVSDRGIRRLNKLYRGKNKKTDVLSFPAEQDEFEKLLESTLGDVVISVDRAEEQALENGLDLDTEIAQLILHGLLHLHGYDHETDNGEMNRIELRLRKRLGI